MRLDRSVSLTHCTAMSKLPKLLPALVLWPGRCPGTSSYSPLPSSPPSMVASWGGGGDLRLCSPWGLLHVVATGPCVRVDFLPLGAMGVPLTPFSGASQALGANVPPLSSQLSRRAQPQGKQEEPMTNGGSEPASTKQAPCAPPTQLPAAWP